MKRLLKAGFHAPSAMTLKFALSLVLSCAFLPGLDAADYADVEARETDRRDARLNGVDTQIRKAVELRDAGRFKDAVEVCTAALQETQTPEWGNAPMAVDTRKNIRSLEADIRARWGQSLIMPARTLIHDAYSDAAKDTAASSEKAKKAVELAREARSVSPTSREAAEQIIKMGEKLLNSNNYVEKSTLETLDPDNASRKEQIAVYLREAAIFYKSKQYAKARDVLERVLILDPYNEKAVYDLKKVYQRLYRIAELRRENDILEHRSESEWKWNNSFLPRGDQLVDERGPQEAVHEGKAKMYEKLQSIVIPSVEFSDQSITTIVSALTKLSKMHDPEGKGVIIVYSPSDKDMQEVSLSFTNIPVGEIIRYLCQYTKLKYKVEDNAVRIASEGIDDMDTRYFKMRSDVYARLTGQKLTDNSKKSDKKTLQLGETSSTSKDDFFDDIAKGEKADNQVDAKASLEALKKYFEVRGIRFEPGAMISYDERTGRLTVKNTPDYLRAMENLLREIDIVTPLVLIEAKFLEINVTDLEELGFDWTMTRDNSNPKWMTGIANSETGKIPFDGAQMFETLVRHYGGSDTIGTTDSSSNPAALINNLNIMPNFGPNGAYNVFLTVNAIDQSDRGETLSAPKLIVVSGMNATIEFAKQMYFPDSWNDPEVTTSNNTYLYTPPYPDFGDATSVGVTFSVTPYVSPNNHTIELTLTPKILDLVGWTEYQYDIIIGSTRSQRAAMKMPELAVREIDTRVKVYNGETIVLGGILEDSSSQLDDKFPFLGDVPLLGRLFATQAHRQSKCNLMIFVTTRIMNLDGVPVKTNADNGLFDFNR